MSKFVLKEVYKTKVVPTKTFEVDVADKSDVGTALVIDAIKGVIEEATNRMLDPNDPLTSFYVALNND